MIVRPEHIAKASINLLAQGIPSETVAKNIYLYLDKYKKINLFPEVLKYISKEHTKLSNRNLIEIVFARESDADNTIIEAVLEHHHLNKEYDYQVSERPEIIGGYIVKSQGIVFDNSIRQRLQTLKQDLQSV